VRHTTASCWTHLSSSRCRWPIRSGVDWCRPYDTISSRSCSASDDPCRSFRLLRRRDRQGEKLFASLKCASCQATRPGRGPRRRCGKLRSRLFSGRHGGGHVEPRHTNVGSRGRGKDRKAADHHRPGGGFVRLPFGWLRPAESVGDVARGQKVFEAKLCASCHEQFDTGAPNLAAKAGQFSAFSMVSALWQHGRGMLSAWSRKTAMAGPLSPGDGRYHRLPEHQAVVHPTVVSRARVEAGQGGHARPLLKRRHQRGRSWSETTNRLAG